MSEALLHSKQYAAFRDANYVPALYNRLGYLDITAITKQAAADIEIAQGWKPGTLEDSGKGAGAEKGFRTAPGTSLVRQKRFPCRFNDAYSSPNTHPTP